MLALGYWMLLGPFLKFTCSRIRGPVPVPVSVPVPVPVFPYCATMVQAHVMLPASLWKGMRMWCGASKAYRSHHA